MESAGGTLLVLPDGSLCREDLIVERYSRRRAVSLSAERDSNWLRNLKVKNDFDQRSPTEKDRDRLVYSAYLQRLSGVTQIVTPPSDGPGLHSRFVHTLKVANLARAIATDLARKAHDNSEWLTAIAELGGLDIAACEAAGLAHDVGHPPFGHLAESIIDQWLRSEGDTRGCPNGFEGNAQSFRTVTRLDLRDQGSHGLELTSVTLAAILKYPWLRCFGNAKLSKKFGALHTEEEEFNHARGWFTRLQPGFGQTQTLEAAIMDLADDITYALHDLQDFILAGVIRTSDVVRDLNSSSRAVKRNRNGEFAISDSDRLSPKRMSVFLFQADDLANYYPDYFDLGIFKEALTWAANCVQTLDFEHEDDIEHVAMVRSTVSAIIGDLLETISLQSTPKWTHGPVVYLDQESWHKVQILKQITKAYVIETPLVGMHQAAQSVMIQELLAKLEEWCARPKSAKYIPVRLRAHIGLNEELVKLTRGNKIHFPENVYKRAIADYCCSLSDLEAYKLVRFLQGQEIPRVVL